MQLIDMTGLLRRGSLFGLLRTLKYLHDGIKRQRSRGRLIVEEMGCHHDCSENLIKAIRATAIEKIKNPAVQRPVTA